MENFEIYENISNTEFTQAEIVESIKVCLNDISPLIKPTVTLKNMVYHILKAYLIDKKRFVIAQCPTGSGKTIIGFMTYFCMQYIINKKFDNYIGARPEFKNIRNAFAYFLTSNKVLQEQIDNDIRRFDFLDYMFLLKGVANYECIPANKEFKNGHTNLKQKVLDKNPQATFASYEFRPCVGKTKEQIDKRWGCLDECPYKTARNRASYISCAILNYAYFLNVMRKSSNPDIQKFFGPRFLTISDEAHLIPDIVCNMFNYEITQRFSQQLNNFITAVRTSFGDRQELIELNQINVDLLYFFHNPLNRISDALNYYERLIKVHELLKSLKKSFNENMAFNRMFNDTYISLMDKVENVDSDYERLKKLYEERPEDIYFESEKVFENKSINAEVYKHIIKDLKEAEMVRTNFIDNLCFGLFMSATLGDMDEYAKLMGIEEDEYTSLMLPSTFDFSKSPIYLTESGYLNYNSFYKNIDKVLNDCIRLCNIHKNEKGVIHTSTFKIGQLLKQKILNLGNTINISRFLFYNTTKEKEDLIEVFKNSGVPYILVGPSLYEGIDLPDDKCRFQILIKVPYAQINTYIKKKMERYPFWYKRNCIEKIIQAIGRSNRHKNDYSTIYLLDSLFNKIIYDTNEEIVNRIEYKRVY